MSVEALVRRPRHEFVCGTIPTNTRHARPVRPDARWLSRGPFRSEAGKGLLRLMRESCESIHATIRRAAPAEQMAESAGRCRSEHPRCHHRKYCRPNGKHDDDWRDPELRSHEFRTAASAWIHWSP